MTPFALAELTSWKPILLPEQLLQPARNGSVSTTTEQLCSKVSANCEQESKRRKDSANFRMEMVHRIPLGKAGKIRSEKLAGMSHENTAAKHTPTTG